MKTYILSVDVRLSINVSYDKLCSRNILWCKFGFMSVKSTVKQVTHFCTISSRIHTPTHNLKIFLDGQASDLVYIILMKLVSAQSVICGF